ncbi:response regulator [bacterium]|nr:response regulator [bacterium]
MVDSKPILVVEDDRVDFMTVKRAHKYLEIPNRLDHVNNGEEALAYLRSVEDTPALILLDLNMPRMNGLEFLEVAKRDDLLKRIPVIVLTTSKEDHDKLHSFNLSVAGYMVKPVDYQQFIEVLKTIYVYWSLSESYA